MTDTARDALIAATARDTGPSAREKFYAHIDRAIARSIDSRLPGLVQDIAEAVARELANPSAAQKPR